MKSGLSPLVFSAAFALALVASSARADTGEDMNIHNNTGHEVVVFMFQEGGMHVDEAGGTQFAHLKNGESAVAHVPDCEFSVLLVDDEDIWAAEVHDCHSTDLTFNADTGHSTKAVSDEESDDNATDDHDDADHDDGDDGDDDGDVDDSDEG